LFGFLGVCATLAFRPQAADVVLSLLGLKHEESANTFPSPEFLSQNSTSGSNSETEGNAVSRNTFGSAISYSASQNAVFNSTSGFQDMPPMFGTFPEQALSQQPETPNPALAPSWNNYNNNIANSVHSLEPQRGIGFGDYAGIPIQDVPAFPVDSNGGNSSNGNFNNDDGFATSHGVGHSHHAPYDNDVVFAVNPPSGSSSSDLSTSQFSVGFADFHAAQNNETHNAEDGFASSGSQEIKPAAYQQNVFGTPNNVNFQNVPALADSKTQTTGVTVGGHSIANASVVMPDPQNDAKFGHFALVAPANYEHRTDGAAELVNIPVQANIPQTQMTLNPTPPLNVPMMDVPQLQESQNNVLQNNISQNNFPQNNIQQDYVSSQPQVMPQSPPQFETPQFVLPPFHVDSPQIVAMQTPQAQSLQQLQPLPQQPSVSNPSSPFTTSMQNPVATNPRSQYEPDVLAEFQTVFGAQPLARVSSDIFIQTCDILPDLKEQLDFQWPLICRDSYKQNHRMPTANEERQFKAQQIQETIEQGLDARIEVALMYHDMTLNVPQEHIDQLNQQIGNDFDLKIIPELMKQYQVTNRYDLDRELQKHGTFLERKRKNYIENQMGIGWFSSKLKSQTMVLTYDQIRNYYSAHKEDKYKHPGNVKWEELAVLFSRTANEQEAYAQIVELGNRVLKGESFTAIAKQGSHGLTANLGGTREMQLERGSLITQQVEQAIFQLPAGKMSTIIRDKDGFYIVRVTERIENSYTPLDQVVNEIKTSIMRERGEKERTEILADLRKKYPVMKTNELRNIAEMAAKVELNMPIDESESRYRMLLARAEQIAPEKKPTGQSSPQPQQMIASQPHPANANDMSSNRVAMVSRHDVPQPSATSFDQQEEKEPEKKKSIFSSLNPFGR
jgi:hypothetical protein